MLVVFVCEKQNKKFNDGLSYVKSIFEALTSWKKCARSIERANTRQLMAFTPYIIYPFIMILKKFMSGTDKSASHTFWQPNQVAEVALLNR